MEYKRQCRASADLSNDHLRKLVAAKASPGVVSILTHNAPAEMIETLPDYEPIIPPPKEYTLVCSGIVIESSPHNDSTYLSIILVPASLFKFYPPGFDVQIDVTTSDSVLSTAKLLACDFHYNLAALTLVSDSPLPIVTLRRINDIFPICPTQYQQQLLQPQPHSDRFNLGFGTPFFTVSRSHFQPKHLFPDNGEFCSRNYRTSEICTCNELLCIDSISLGLVGGPVLNHSGEVIGILSDETLCMPSNLILRWWINYKSSRKFRRPFVGLEIANLVEANVDFLSNFMLKFPKISSAVIVTKVLEGSPAGRAGIKTNDVITILDGKSVQCKSEFYDLTWEAGKAMSFNIIRTTTEEELNIAVTIEETRPEEFYRWPHPSWRRV